MTEKLKKSDNTSYTKLKDAVALITILVAGADGKIDLKESDWAEKLTEVRSYSTKSELKAFYKDVGLDYHQRFEYFIDTLPGGLDARNKEISDKLTELNDILPKLGKKTAALMYEDYISFASHVAKTSGGFLGFMTVSRAEEKVMKLEMINKFE